jgi:hypothetical protein
MLFPSPGLERGRGEVERLCYRRWYIKHLQRVYRSTSLSPSDGDISPWLGETNCNCS